MAERQTIFLLQPVQLVSALPQVFYVHPSSCQGKGFCRGMLFLETAFGLFHPNINGFQRGCFSAARILLALGQFVKYLNNVVL